MTTHDADNVAETGVWLRYASQDMRAAANGMSADPPLLGDVVFHCQQAAEKSLRGFLAWHGIPFRETNDLAEIGAQCVELDSSLEPIVTQAASLTEYAWKYRYPSSPGESEEPTTDEVQQAMNVTHSVASAIIDRLPEDIHQA